jgi:hypothetical protein
MSERQTEEAALVALTRFAIHLIAHIEAVEKLLVQKSIVTKQEIQAAAEAAEVGLRIFDRSIPHPGEQNFEPELTDLLERLQARHRDLIW